MPLYQRADLESKLAPSKSGNYLINYGWHEWISYIEVKKTSTKGQLAKVVNDAYAEIEPMRDKKTLAIYYGLTR